MHTDPVYTEVVQALSQTLVIDASKITLTSRLQEDLEVTSLDLVTIAMDMEKKYGTEVFEDQIKGLVTVYDLVEYVRQRLKVVGVNL